MKKKFIVSAVLGFVFIAAFAGTCTVTHISLVTTDGTHKTFAGQLDNTSGVNILQHDFLVAFLDANNNVVETQTVQGCTRSIQDGQTGYFSATSTLPAAQTNVGLARIAFDSTFAVGTVATGNVAVSNVVVTRSGSSLVVTGQVKNNDSNNLVAPAACIVVRTAGGNVLITGKDASMNDLAQNATDTFSVTITVPNDDTASSVDVWVDGLVGTNSGAPIAPVPNLGNAVACPSANTATNTPPATSTTTPVPTDTPTNTPVATDTPTNTPMATSTPC